MQSDQKMCRGRNQFVQIRRVKSLRPVHWVVVFAVTVVCTAYILLDTASKVTYVRSQKDPTAATRALDVDHYYKAKLQELSRHLQAQCVRGIAVVFAHNIDVDGTRYSDHAFHVCGGKTWANGRISRTSEDKIQCQEEYANTYKTRVQPKRVTMKAIDVDAWAEREVSADMLRACQWTHAIDVLDGKW